jgi:hypothetical protein
VDDGADVSGDDSGDDDNDDDSENINDRDFVAAADDESDDPAAYHRVDNERWSPDPAQLFVDLVFAHCALPSCCL